MFQYYPFTYISEVLGHISYMSIFNCLIIVRMHLIQLLANVSLEYRVCLLCPA